MLSKGSEQTYETLPLFDLLLNLVTGGGNLSLSGQNGTQKGGQRSSYGCIERPAQRTERGSKGRGFVTAVTNHLL